MAVKDIICLPYVCLKIYFGQHDGASDVTDSVLKTPIFLLTSKARLSKWDLISVQKSPASCFDSIKLKWVLWHSRVSFSGGQGDGGQVQTLCCVCPWMDTTPSSSSLLFLLEFPPKLLFYLAPQGFLRQCPHFLSLLKSFTFLNMTEEKAGRRRRSPWSS